MAWPNGGSHRAPLDPSSSTLQIEIMERNCANGEPPVGREVVEVVDVTDEAITITVLVEPVPGLADCPSNPWHPVTVELGEPLGDRRLVDGSTIPPGER